MIFKEKLGYEEVQELIFYQFFYESKKFNKNYTLIILFNNYRTIRQLLRLCSLQNEDS